jgi:hypothetical protein
VAERLSSTEFLQGQRIITSATVIDPKSRTVNAILGVIFAALEPSMNRKQLKSLANWLNAEDRKPLVIRGARRIG